jgi:hypothetical protein
MGAMELDYSSRELLSTFFRLFDEGHRIRAEKSHLEYADAHESFLSIGCTTRDVQGIPTSEYLAKIISEGRSPSAKPEEDVRR